MLTLPRFLTQILTQTTRKALVANIVISVGCATLCNGVIFALGWNGVTVDEVEPPGLEWVDSVVGLVWVVLFALMAIARWLLLKSRRSSAQRHAQLVTNLIIFCWLYPFYTLGFQRLPGLIGNLVTIGFTAWVTLRVWQTSRPSAGLIGLVFLWSSFATFYLIRLIQLNPLW